jgi:Mg2+ and Co2+ transporter CorA
VIVDVAICVDGGRGPSLPPADLYDARQDRGGFTWVGLYEPSEVVFTCVTSGFGPHMLAVKDAIKTQQRPKVDPKDDSVFVVLKWVRYAEGSRLLSTGPATVLYAIMGHQYDQVKEMSAWAATLAVPIGFTSIYGMHFTYMPDPAWKEGRLSAVACPDSLDYGPALPQPEESRVALGTLVHPRRHALTLRVCGELTLS